MKSMDVCGEMKSFERTLKRVNDLKEPDKTTLLGFYQSCRKEQIGFARITNYLIRLMQVSKWLGKPLSEAIETDIMRIVDELDFKDYTEWTKASYRITLRKFYKYIWIKTTIKRNKKKLPEDLVPEEEALIIVNAAKTLRNKALLASLYDVGCRPAEILTLRVKSVVFDEYGAVISLSGKTGPRMVRTIFSTAYLRQWHSCLKDPEAPLWPSMNNKGGHDYLGEDGLCVILKKAVKDAGIKKRVYPYLFRHSRATHNAGFMTDAQMCAYHGWAQGSKMAGVYVHMSGRDVDKTLLSHYGLKQENKENTNPKRCPRCQEINASNAEYCIRCGMPLSNDAIYKLGSSDSALTQVAMKLISILNEKGKNEEVERLLAELSGK